MTNEALGARHPPGQRRWRLLEPRVAALALLAVAMGGAVIAHAGFVAGPEYWKWGWWRLSFARTAALLAPPLVVIIAVEWSRQRRSISAPVAVGASSVAAFALMLLVLGAPYRPFSLEKIRYVVEDPAATSYYTAAAGLDGETDLLGDFPERMSDFRLHARTKPPGPVLYYRWLLDTVGPGRASFIGGLLLGMLAALGVPATYLLSRVLDASEEQAVAAANMMLLAPGFVLFFPSFDAVYPLLTVAILVPWVLGLRRDRLAFSALAGLALAAALFLAYNFLVLGAAMALYAGFVAGVPPRRLGVVARNAAALLTATLGAYIVLGLVTGFDPVATFRTALAHQHALGTHQVRPYPSTIPWDLSDFALGAGWLAVALAALALVRQWNRGPASSEGRFWTAIAFAQPLIVAISGLLATETARVWIFLMPLLVHAAGGELGRWRWRWRALVLVLAWVLLVLIRQNMYFVAAGPKPV